MHAKGRLLNIYLMFILTLYYITKVNFIVNEILQFFFKIIVFLIFDTTLIFLIQYIYIRKEICNSSTAKGRIVWIRNPMYLY